jgi:prepilin-type N-terminal cleavage/methylation domain-containing protein
LKIVTLAISPRRGITLLEVLIAIGILAIGLSSVVAILPAAKSQANRAVVLDRASNLAANILADAATFGVLREGALNPTPAAGTLAIIDPAIAAAGYSFADSQPALRNAGIFSTSSAGNAPPSYHRLFTDGRDDILLGPPPNPDALPTHLFSDGTRAYQGRMTALLAIRIPQALPSAALKSGVLSVVVFHNRDIGSPAIEGSLDGVSLTIPPHNIPEGRTFRELIKPGVVIYDGARFHQLKSAAIQDNAGSVAAFVTLSNIPPTSYPVTITLFPDSVGLAERPYTPEINGAFLR